MTLEIPLYIIGYVVWAIIMIIPSWFMVAALMEKVYGFAIIFLGFFSLTVFGGIYMCCNLIWECPELVRFV